MLPTIIQTNQSEKCPVCLASPPASPLLLKCFHSICKPCFETLAQQPVPCSCPLCRAPIDTKNPEATEVANEFLSRLEKDQKAQDELDPNNIKCEMCDDTDAVSKCVDCDQFGCSTCFKSHARLKVTQHHKIISIEEALNSHLIAPTLCKIHTNLTLSQFCNTCSTVFCAECVVDSHSQHETGPLEKIVLAMRGALSSQLETLSSAQKKFTIALTQTKDKQLLKEHAQTVHTQIRAHTAAKIWELQKQGEELLSQVTISLHQQEKELVLHEEDCTFKLEQIKAAERFVSVLATKGNDAEIASNYRPFQVRFKTLKELADISLIPPKTFIDFKEISHLPPLGILTTSHDALPVEIKLPALITSLNKPFSFTIQGSSDPIYITASGPESLIFKESSTTDSLRQITTIPPKEGTYTITATCNGRLIPNTPFELEVRNSVIFTREYQKIQNYRLRFRDRGAGDGQFDKPTGVCTNKNNDIIVADTFNHRIQVFNKDGLFLFNFGSQGTVNGTFNLPVAVLCNPKDEIIVSDTGNHRIQIFDPKGTFLSSFGWAGKEEGQLNAPHGICFDREHNLIVADRGNNRLQTFNPAGKHLRTFYPLNEAKNPILNGPTGVGLRSDGVIMISERNISKLTAFNARTQKSVWEISQGFNNPFHIFVDSTNNTIVADCNNHIIQVINPEGNLICRVGENLSLAAPTAVSLDSNGRLIICEQQGFRITVL